MECFAAIFITLLANYSCGRQFEWGQAPLKTGDAIPDYASSVAIGEPQLTDLVGKVGSEVEAAPVSVRASANVSSITNLSASFPWTTLVSKPSVTRDEWNLDRRVYFRNRTIYRRPCVAAPEEAVSQVAPFGQMSDVL